MNSAKDLGINKVSPYKAFESKVNVPQLSTKFNQSQLRVQLSFNNVIIRSKPKRVCFKKQPGRNILRGVSGTIMPGEFMTILGASGAGKTTLLNYLSGKNFSRNLMARGDVTYNGIARDNIDYRSLTAYVMQDDILFDTLTVRGKNLSVSLRMSSIFCKS